MRTKSEKRRNDRKAAVRKYRIIRDVWHDDEYAAALIETRGLHALSKNKIHCSCPMCSAKTKRDGYKVSDIRKIERASFVEDAY